MYTLIILALLAGLAFAYRAELQTAGGVVAKIVTAITAAVSKVVAFFKKTPPAA